MRTPLLDPMQVYRNRDYVHGAVDARVFEALNYEIDGVWVGKLAFTGCLDAICEMPAGAMCGRHGVRSQLTAHRESDSDSEEAFAALIDEILQGT